MPPNTYFGLLCITMMIVFYASALFSADKRNKKVEKTKTIIISVLVAIYLAVYLLFYYSIPESIKSIGS